MQYNLSVSNYLDRSWNSLSKNLALTMGLSLVYFIAQGVISFVPVAGTLIGFLLTPGYIICLDRIRKGQDFSFTEFFWCFLDLQRAIHFIILSVVKTFLIILGFICLLIPGFYLTVAFLLAETHFVLNKQDGIIALKEAKTFAQGRWWFFANLMAAFFLLNIVGFICLGIGLLITVPMTVVALIFLLEDLTKPESQLTNLASQSL